VIHRRNTDESRRDSMTEASTRHQELLRPLEGIRVVEYGIFHAGPGGTAILGDLGAEVIKIEQGSGDPERFWLEVAGYELSLKNGESIAFEISNRNKKSICLDIERKEGRKIFNRMISEEDVFLTNLRKSTKFKMGLDYETLCRLNSQLIYAGVSGFGPEGPMSDLGAFDPLGQAISGMMYVTGTSEPVNMHLGILDQATAIAVSHAILTALLVRERKGIGQEVHVSLYGTALWNQHGNLMVANALSIDPCIPNDRSKHSPLRNRFRCHDGKWVLGTHHPEESYWATFCKVTGQTALLNDPRFTDDAGRPKNYAELNAFFDEIFATKPADEWTKILQNKGLMFCRVQRIEEVQTDPQALANDYVVPFDHPILGRVNIPGYPVHFSSCQVGTQHSAPKLGEHTNQILQDMGYTAKEIDRLRNEGVLR
jgi:crotonobetainyl-CoA:carnitine CoA-transferase CaiB-like acyl-CoA transferase